MAKYQVGTTVLLECTFYDRSDNLIDADASPPVIVEIRDARGNPVQSGLPATRVSQGYYNAYWITNKRTNPPGIYFHSWMAYFSGKPASKSKELELGATVT